MTHDMSYSEFSTAVSAMATMAGREGRDVPPSPERALHPGGSVSGRHSPMTGVPYLSKVEAIASSAVRTADTIDASLLIVFTHSGNTAQLVSKYRPKMPILTLVVPRVITDSLKWKLEGREVARQCLLVRGLLPMLAAPKATAGETLKEALIAAKRRGLVNSGDRIVVVQRIHEDFAFKIVSIDDIVSTNPTNLTPTQLLKTLSDINYR